MILTVKNNCQAFFLMIHYKAPIKARNRWMINSSDIVIVYTISNYGGAYEAKRYSELRETRIDMRLCASDGRWFILDTFVYNDMPYEDFLKEEIKVQSLIQFSDSLAA